MSQRILATLLLCFGIAAMSACGGGGGGGGASAPSIAIGPGAVSAPTVGTAYSQTFTASGGTPPYVYTQTGAGVAGLVLSAAGVLQGTPTVAGAVSLTVNVADSSVPSRLGSRTYSVTVNASAGGSGLVVNPNALPVGKVGFAFAASLSVTGGVAPYTYQQMGTGVPGITVSSSGNISGTPTTVGAYALTVKATDSTLPTHITGTKVYNFVVNPVGGSTMQFTTTSLPSGTVGLAYSGIINMTGGVAPYTFSETGSPIPGLTLTSTQVLNAGGVLSGTPTTAGTYTYNVQGTDSTTPSALLASTSFTITVNPPGGGQTTELAAKTTFSDNDVEHVLTRVFWGVNAGQVATVQGQGVSAYIDSMLNTVTDTNMETQAMAEIANPNFPNGYSEIPNYWLHLMVKTNNPFQETMAFFWHDLFATATSVLGQESFHYMTTHVNLLRAHALGNIKTFLYELSRDWAMLEWLNGLDSTKNAPNENFARELWELFTLGADNGYTQTDIVQAAKCFTGYRRRLDAGGKAYVEFDPNRHDTTNKTIFGQTVTGRSGSTAYLEYQDVVNLTFDNRPVAEFFAKKLFEYFCYKNPPQAVIDQLAAQLRSNNYDVKPTIKTLLMSNAFYSEQATGSTTYPEGGLVKNPVEFTIGFIRSTGLEIPYDTLRSLLSNAGQLPTFPPSVNGWPEGELWASADGLVQRANIIHSCITNRTYQNGLGVSLLPILPPAGQRTASNTVDELASHFNIQMTPAERLRYINYLDSDFVAPSTVNTDPFDASNATQIDKKVRGLLYIMAQHPSFNVR
jgi:uncharacterized protein (DUF1800 family)